MSPAVSTLKLNVQSGVAPSTLDRPQCFLRPHGWTAPSHGHQCPLDVLIHLLTIGGVRTILTP